MVKFDAPKDAVPRVDLPKGELAAEAQTTTINIKGRCLVLATDGNQVDIVQCTMGLLELKQALEMLHAEVIRKIQATATRKSGPADAPAPAAAEPEPA
uniref:Uncharacterized protein n=1 Tax=viral metagenome TaxID=1070528 RepID=A0A6H1ZH41_9ZZZZ